MTARERIRRTQRVLGVTALVQAIGWGLAAILTVLAATSFAAVALRGAQRASSAAIAVLIGIVVTGVVLWQRRHFVSPNRVALWVEERIPALQYSLVTALEHTGSPFAAPMENEISRHDMARPTFRAVRRQVLPALAALLVAALLLYVSPSGVFGRSADLPGLTGSRAAAVGAAGSRLNDLRVEVTPPAYTRARGATLEDPSSVSAMVGSTIAVRGSGSPDGLTAFATASLRVVPTGRGWSVSLAMPSKPAAITLGDRGYERIIVLDPRADDPPKAVLTSPVRDTTLRTPRLTVQLRAAVSDDVGLTTGYFEYLITTGSGEIFKARTINTPVVHFDDARTGSLSATLDLSSLKLGEGDVLSMRAIAQDGNTVSGPGIATSDTRTIRIARAGEYDSLSIEAAAPPPLDSSAVSQRMLIAMAEKLVREQPKIARAELVRRSTEIGDLEDGVRKRVQEILTESEGAGEDVAEPQPGAPAPTTQEMESPETITGAKNPDLKAAYDALWKAVRSLKIAEPGPALPPMRVALAALDRARLANRLYLRGAPPKIIVNIDRVRLSGKEKGSSSVRTPRTLADSLRVQLSARFYAMVDIIAKNPARAMTELALLRVDALLTFPDFAAALSEANDAVRAGRDATLPLLRARRVLDGPPEVRPLGAWMGG